jgi:glycosyltransferase involved in cell wall biosynthesis
MKLVYFSPSPWTSFVQRPHKFVEWFMARHGGRVLWVDPYPTRLPAWRDVHRLGGNFGARLNHNPKNGLIVLSPQALPIEPLPGARFLNRFLWQEALETIGRFATPETFLGIGKPSQLALTVMRRLKFSMIFHDYMDDFPAFCEGISRKHMERVERETIARAAKGIASSTLLCARWKNGSAVLVRNAFDAQSLPAIPGRSRTASPPILGYVGTIDHWFDWDVVLRIARAFPRYILRLIGPLLSPAAESLPGNIELLPPCSLPDALAAMQGFSAGLIPFKINRLTKSVDPIKYYEYRAMGLPVLSTAFGEMTLHDIDPGVFLFNRDNAPAMVEAALALGADLQGAEEFRQSNSWEARFAALDSFFEPWTSAVSGAS